MHDTDYATRTYLRSGHNLVKQARRNLCVGNTEEARALLVCADEQLCRAESPTAEILPFPKLQELEPA